MALRRAKVGAESGATVAELEARLGHRFAAPELLVRALTHRSHVYEGAADDGLGDNEQLEFVGDAVVGLVMAEALYRRYPAAREGELTRLRAMVVSRKHLGACGAQLELGRWLRLGLGEAASGGREKPALLANAMEAVIAAVYLDGGLGAARQMITVHVLGPVAARLDAAVAEGERFSGAVGDHKSALQEQLQAAGRGQPRYELKETMGPDHKRVFVVSVGVEGSDGPPLAEGEGTSKKLAQQEAARLALIALAGGAEVGADG